MTRPATIGENGYRLVFGNGLVWLIRGNGTPVRVSTWQPTCLAQSASAAAALMSMAAEDERMLVSLPKPGERARILASEYMDRIGATGRRGVVLKSPGVCIVVELDDASGIEQYTSWGQGVVFCTNSEVEREEGAR